MANLFPAQRRPLHALFTLILSVSLVLGVAAPQPADAQSRTVGRAIGAAIVGTAIVCATHPHLCGADGRPLAQGGTADAIALTGQQAMWVQEGLQATGFYYGPIDGAIGPGTRSSIRDYQAATGDPATGALTGEQINDLVAVSPSFAPYATDASYMFNADLANDLGPDGVYQLQNALNGQGYGAGVADGAFGGNTRNAIAAYKASYGLPGAPLATRRLLSYMTGAPAPVPAGMAFIAPPQMEPITPAPVAEAEPAPAADLTFDIVGVTLGQSADAVKATLGAEYGAAFPYETADAATFGGTDMVSSAALAVKPDWPAPGSEQMLTLYDAARPELGLIAAFRLIQMPEGVDQGAFEAQVLPGIIAKYGEEAMFGDGRMWVGNAAARTAARNDPNALAACGDLRLASIAPAADANAALWSQGGGVMLDTASLDSVTADCGNVVSVVYDGSMIRIGMWNSSALSSTVVAPAIKF